MVKHRLKFHSIFSLFGILGLIGFNIASFLVTSGLFWIISIVATFIFVCALVFEMKFWLSNLILVGSVVISVLGVTLINLEVPIYSNYPTYLLLLIPLTYILIMKSYSQMAIFTSANLIGLTFIVSYTASILSIFVISMVAGLGAAAVAFIALVSHSWNVKIGSVMAFTAIIFGTTIICWLLFQGIILAFSIGLPLLGMLSIGIAVVGLITSGE